MLAVIETHPIQYHAPIYRALQEQFRIPVTAIYGSDFSVAGYYDQEFGASFAWDSDLLAGYASQFLSRVAEGGAREMERVSARGLGHALREVTPSAVLLAGYSPRFHQVAIYEAWRYGSKMLFRGDTTDHAGQRSFVKSFARDQALRWLYGRCARLLYVGKRSEAHFRRLGFSGDKLCFSPNCVDVAPFAWDERGRAQLREYSRTQLDLTVSDIALLFSGKLREQKGPDLLIEAVRRLPADIGERAVVLFLGSGELETSLRALVEQSPRVATRFLGFQNQSQLSQYYHAADLLVLPSRWGETWGLVVNDALHHGLPCVVSDTVGCAPDLIEPGVTGEVCAAGSIDSLTGAIERCVKLTDRREVREWCRRKVSGYTVERAAEGIAEAYRTVAGS